VLRLAMVLGTAAAVALIVWALRWLLSGRAARHRFSLRRRGGRWLPYLAIVVVLFGDLAIDALGSFGLADRSDAAWQSAAGLITGPLYGGIVRRGQREIVIVALDDDFVARHGGRWPPSYKDVADVLNRISPARPKAVFLDFYFDRVQSTADGQPDKGGIAVLADAMQNLGAPVVSGPIADLPELKPLRDSDVKQVSLRAEEELAYAYPLRDERGWTAAPTLYALMTGKPPNVGGDVLALEWGFGASKWVGDRSEPGWACVAYDLRSRIVNFLRLGLRAAAPALHPKPNNQGLTMACPYFDTIGADFVSRPKVQERLHHKIVMVGSTTSLIDDYADSPLLGRVPGVTVHAMALDNLMHWRGDATVYPAKAFWGLDMGDLAQVGLLLLGFGLAARADRDEPDPKRRFRTRLWVWALIAALGIAIACLNAWPMFKLMSAALIGLVSLEAWERLREAREEEEAI
jgi:hypothetical protein